MELDPQLQDDNNSFASSHSLPNSEDVDDLRLGAEANTFSPNFDKAKGENATINSFLIIRRGHSLDEEDSFFTFSTISSISDLIDARECDPEDLLFQLGFTHIEGTKSHSSILSRFNGSLHARTATSYSPDHRRHEISYDARDGIVKAQEWLNTQQNDNDGVLFPNLSKDMVQGYKVSPPGVGRKIAQKKRLKWSKSRQSSFEHLLPNLQEESAVEVQESENDVVKDESAIQPIRESSIEQEHYHSEVKDILHALADPSLKHLSASKCPNLINMKVDSFELEEVVSNDGAAVTGRMAADTSIIDSANVNEDSGDEGQRNWDHCNPASSVGSVDSSSGFDEGPDDVVKSSAEQSPTTSALRSEKSEHQAAESSSHGSSDMQAVHGDSSKFNNVSVCSCVCGDVVAVTCASCQCKRDSGESNEGKVNPHCSNCLLEEVSSGSDTKDGVCKWSDSHRSAASLPSVQSMQDYSHKQKLHYSKLSSKSFSNLNSNFNNSVEDSLSSERPGQLRRTRSFFSSTPTLSSAVFPRNPAADCEFFNLDQRKVSSSSSLMTSIADVAYLSYKRFFSENHKILKSSQSFSRSGSHKTNDVQNSTFLPQ